MATGSEKAFGAINATRSRGNSAASRRGRNTRGRGASGSSSGALSRRAVGGFDIF